MLRRMPATLALLVLLCASLGCQRVQQELAAAQNPYPSSSPLHAPFDRTVRELVADPRYVAAMQAAGSQDAALRKGFALSMDGLLRLDDAALERRLTLLSAIMDASDASACAALARPDPANPKATSDAVMAGLEKLLAEQIEAWFDFSLRSTKASLDKAPLRAVAPQQSQAAFEALLQRLPETERSRMTRTLSEARQANASDMCWAGRTLYRQVLQLPQAQRSVLARTLASPD